MKLVNRSYLIIHPKNPFWEWAAGSDNEIVYNSSDDTEGTLYLIEEDFFDIEPIIEKHFKKIFINELSSITDEEENWPSERNFEIFSDWFRFDYGSIVMDFEKTDLKRESID
jgi:dolichyl-phosphate-mannose--protein O-mannosyl transferase